MKITMEVIMAKHRRISGFLPLTVLALLGALILYLANSFSEQYRTVSPWGQPWISFCVVAVATGGVLLLSVMVYVLVKLWLQSRRKRRLQVQRDRSPSELSAVQQQQEIRENLAEVKNLTSEPSLRSELHGEIKPLVQHFVDKRELGTLEIVAFGTVSSGKSSLLNSLAGRDVFATDARGGTTLLRNEVPWAGADKVSLVDTPGLAEVDGEHRQRMAAETARDADLVLVVVDGPLRQFEFQLLELLSQMEKRIVLCLNKEDWYEENERMELVDQIVHQVKAFVTPHDVVVVRARPTQQHRVRVLADGRTSTETVEVPADIESLARRMMKIIHNEGQQLLLANLLLQSRGLVEKARRRVKASLDRQAWKTVESHTWGAAGAAALSPFPVVDLAAGCAVSTKMVLDLARIYHQDMDQETAMKTLSELSKHLIGLLGGVTATAAVGSLLKTIPGAGWVVGGLLQGVSQALVTRWIGSVFIEYFGTAMQRPEGGMAGLARRQWEEMTNIKQLRKLIRTAQKNLLHAK